MKTLTCFRFKGPRNYIHGTDIFNVFNDFFLQTGGHLFCLTFKHFSKNFLWYSESPPELGDTLVAHGKRADTGGGEYNFWLTESDIPVQERYEFNEDSIIQAATIIDRTIFLEQSAPYSTIEHIIALTKSLNNTLNPILQGKWLFGQLILNMKLPEHFDNIAITLKNVIQNHFSVNAISLDGVHVGQIRFIVGEQ